MSDSVRPHRRQPTRLPCPWDSPGKNTGVGCHFLLQCMKVKREREVAQSCLTLSDPMDCSLTGSSVHGIFQERVLEYCTIVINTTLEINYCYCCCCSVTKLCPILCDPWISACQASISITNSRSLLKLKSIRSVMPSNHLILCLPLSSHLQSFPASGSFPTSQFFASAGQSIRASASASVLPRNIQD